MKIKEKLKASGKHLAISIILISFSLFAIRHLWYPGQLFEVMKAAQIFTVLAVTDVIIGPALTLIIYNKEKIGLHRDLAIIALIQTAALAFGIKALAEARPVWIVYNYGIFDVVRANDISTERDLNTNLASPKSENSWLGPKLVAAKLPENNEERTKILFDTLSGKPDISKNPKYFLPIELAWNEIKAAATPEKLPDGKDIYLLPTTGTAAPAVAIIEKTQEPKIRIIKAL